MDLSGTSGRLLRAGGYGTACAVSAAAMHSSAGGGSVAPSALAAAAVIATATVYFVLVGRPGMPVALTACALVQFGMHWMFNLGGGGGAPIGSAHGPLEWAGAHLLAAVVTAMWLSRNERSLESFSALLYRCFWCLPVAAALAGADLPGRPPPAFTRFAFLPPWRSAWRVSALPERGPPTS